MGYSDEPRQCVVDKAQALFHCWAAVEKPNIEDGRQVGQWKSVAAVVEFRNGDVKLVKPTDVRFLDGFEKFSQYYWGDVNA